MSDNSAWDNLVPKVKAIGLFAKHSVDHEKSREELSSFVSKMKETKSGIKSDLEHRSSDSKFQVRRRSTDPHIRTVRYTDKSLTIPFNQDQDLVCSECEKAMDPFKDTWCPCRVCERVYHAECIRKIKSVRKSIIDTMDRASSNIGWSCHICDDLSSLITETELNSIIEKFENCTHSKDFTMSFDDFLAYNVQLSDEPLTADDEEHFRLKFKLMDYDKNNRIDWWEFLNYEAKIKLGNRTKDELVSLLTEKEVIMAKAVFERLDENKDGSITEWEAKRIYRNWYRRFDDKKNVLHVERDSTDLDLHADSATKMLMESDTSKLGNVSWEDFLSGQALYIICSRPNLILEFPTK